MKKYFIILSCVIILPTEKMNAAEVSPHVISFFVEQYPDEKENKHKNDFHITQNSSGLFATYFGFITTSNNNGQITFPRRQESTSFKILVTQKVEPIFMIHNTIQHWEVPIKEKYALYSVQQHQDDKTKLYFWSIKENKLKNRRIEIDTITLFANPKAIVVPTGITMTNNNPHLFLPKIYTKKTINLTENAFCALSVREFFSPVSPAIKITEKVIQERIAST